MRAIWSGYISFGLVNIPVKLYSATGGQKLTFNLLHKKDLSPIRYARLCKLEEKEIPYNEIVKGYEFEKDQYVVISDEDFENANIRLSRSITILQFCNRDEINPIFFDKPYFLEPDKGGNKPYLLLKEAMKNSKKVGIGKYVLRNREHLISLRPEGDGLLLEELRFKGEVRDINELNLPKDEKVSIDELEVAGTLIDHLTKKFNPEDFVDTYKTELKRVIDDKISGKVPAKKGQAPTATPVPDLLSALKRSLGKESKTKSKV